MVCASRYLLVLEAWRSQPWRAKWLRGEAWIPFWPLSHAWDDSKRHGFYHSWGQRSHKATKMLWTQRFVFVFSCFASKCRKTPGPFKMHFNRLKNQHGKCIKNPMPTSQESLRRVGSSCRSRPMQIQSCLPPWCRCSRLQRSLSSSALESPLWPRMVVVGRGSCCFWTPAPLH